MSDIILCNISDALETINEARLYWAYKTLSAMNVPDEVLFEITDVNEYKYQMEGLGIEIDIINNEEINIYKKEWYEGPTEESSGWLSPTKEHLVAQWKKPTKIMKVEGKETHYEVHLNAWSMFNTRE